MSKFKQSVQQLFADYEALVTQQNTACTTHNGVYKRWANPIVTEAHVPVFWRYDLSEKTNPLLLERQGVNSTYNAGAILFNNAYCLVVRVEGVDRKSFFAIAQSPNGVDNFRFWDYPLEMPETDRPDINVYDMRLTTHEDGYIYGLFCTERKDETQPGDLSAAEAQCGIARTRDLCNWQRLPDLKTRSGQQRNVVLHPEFVDGKYAFYTRPQDGFISVGKGGGVGWGMSAKIDGAEIAEEIIIDGRDYHTIKEVKNGQGPAPLKTPHGWLHLAHGVRNTAAGLRYVLYIFLTELRRPWVVTHRPAGHFMAPVDSERVGDVSNVLFSNGWIINDRGEVFIYYGSSDTRMHVATSTVDRLLDYVMNTPADGLRSAASVAARRKLIASNLELLKK
jgi:4-O-beta-D-mannosyl-D-glucose phosphorylase